jgi:hypothetical protein
VVTAPTDKPYGIREFVVQDVNGVAIVFGQGSITTTEAWLARSSVKTAIAAYGLLLLIVCALGMARPAALIGFVERLWRSPAGLYLAVVIRAAVGALLLAGASSTRFPSLVQALAALALVAAVSRLLIGYHRYHKMIEWWAARGSGSARASSLVAGSFGALLIYVAT